MVDNEVIVYLVLGMIILAIISLFIWNWQIGLGLVAVVTGLIGGFTVMTMANWGYLLIALATGMILVLSLRNSKGSSRVVVPLSFFWACFGPLGCQMIADNTYNTNKFPLLGWFLVLPWLPLLLYGLIATVGSKR